MDKNNQASEDVVVSKRMSMVAWVVSLTSLSWIAAFMLQRKKTAIVMLLMQIALVAYGYYVFSENQQNPFGSIVILSVFILRLYPSWLCVWLWGLILTSKVALTHNELNVIAKGIIIAGFLGILIFNYLEFVPLFIEINKF